MSRLTKRTVEAADPATAPYFIWYAETRGFGVRILAATFEVGKRALHEDAGSDRMLVSYPLRAFDVERGVDSLVGHPRTLLLYLEFKSYYNGKNNTGDLFLSVGDAVQAIGGSRSTICRSFELLEEIGFLIVNKRGVWFGNRGVLTDEGNLEERLGKATTYWIAAVDRDTDSGPTHGSASKEFMRWDPASSRLVRPMAQPRVPRAKPASKSRSVGTVVELPRYSGATSTPKVHHGTS